MLVALDGWEHTVDSAVLPYPGVAGRPTHVSCEQGAFMLAGQAARCSTVRPPHSTSWARAWSALRRVLAGATGPVDLIDALAAELRGDADAPSLTDLHQLATAVPSAANASYYAQRVIDHYVRRQASAMIFRGVRFELDGSFATSVLIAVDKAGPSRSGIWFSGKAKRAGP